MIQNQRVVYSPNLPPPPASWPDPESCSSFSEWLQELTKKHGVKQRVVAEVAGLTPQAVTKWLAGGMVQTENLARIAEWIGVPYQQLRRLLDEAKLGLLPKSVNEPRANYARAESGIPADFVKTWAKLDAESRRQVQGLARLLAAKSGRRK